MESSGEQQPADGARGRGAEPYIPEKFAFDGTVEEPTWHSAAQPTQAPRFAPAAPPVSVPQAGYRLPEEPDRPPAQQPDQYRPAQQPASQPAQRPAQQPAQRPAQPPPGYPQQQPPPGYPQQQPPAGHPQQQSPQGPPPGQAPALRQPQVQPQQQPQAQPQPARQAAAPISVAPPAVAPPRSAPPAPRPQPTLQPTPTVQPSQQPAAPVAVLVEEESEPDFDLYAALTYLLQVGGSDLHVSVGSPPMVRLRGELEAIPEQRALSPQAVQKVLYAILTQKQRERFEEELELDLAYSMPGAARFRVNLYRQRESLGAAFRVIPFEIKTLDELGINPRVATMAALPRGMVLVTGPTGSGKSTTLAALVDHANRTRRDHIMTVEDPIEFLHQNKSCLVNQREVGEDTKSFGAALKHVLRQDPDIILVGEMRDLETISVALTAAETGHLVFATLHTSDAAQTIDRVIDVFPPHQQQQVRVQLASAIQGVVCQTLCKTADGKGRVAATEVLFATGAIRNLIREGKTHQIYSSMQAGAQHGMQTMDQNLSDLVKARKITFEHGLEKCHHVDDFKRLSGRA